MLATTFALFIASRYLLELHPHSATSGFMEAATIRGLADWYAVVALFRRPRGLPIPHTAIIASNQNRIADQLGEFIETHFLEAAPAKLRKIDFASLSADRLRQSQHGNDLARFVLRLLPGILRAAETSGLKTFLARRIVTQLQATDLAPLAAGMLRGFVEDGRRQGLLDDLMRAAHELLSKPETLAAMREKVRNELPTLLKLYAQILSW